MTAARDTLADRIGRRLARKLDAPEPGFRPFTHANVAALRRVLQPGDVLLVEGNSRISVAIKYLTQSTWSHAALYVGNAVGQATPDGEPLSLVEVNVGDGCIAAPLSKYQHYNTRICRPSNLTPQDRARLIDFMVAKPRQELRHEEHHRPAALLAADAAGAGALAPAAARRSAPATRRGRSARR